MIHEGKHQYFFEYEYAGSMWGAEVWADSHEDAQRKVKAMARGIVLGKGKAIRVPNWVGRAWEWLTGTK